MALYQDKKTKKWAYRLSFNDNGKRKQKHSKWYDLKKDAKAAEKEYLELICENIANEDITFEHIWNSYLNFKKEHLKITSYETLKNRQRHIEMLFDIKIIDFDFKVFSKWKKHLNDSDFSTTYKNNLYKLLRSVLKYGGKYFDINIEKLLSKMTGFSNPNELKKEMKFFTYEEFCRFIKIETNLTYKTLFETFYFCGLRQGEALALTWNDIKFDNDTMYININKSMTSKIKGKKFVILPPKNKSSYRTLPIKNKKLINDMTLLKKECQKLYSFSEDWFVFGNFYPIPTSTLQKRKEINRKLANVKQIRIHDFRHSCASLLINKGASVALVSKYLGHSDIATTLKTYTHMFKSELDEIAIGLKDL